MDEHDTLADPNKDEETMEVEPSEKVDDHKPEEKSKKKPKKMKVPKPPPIPDTANEELEEDEESGLDFDESAYVLYHRMKTVAPCLSFDVIGDELGDNRTDYPMSMYLVSGTQASTNRPNALLVMKLHHLRKLKQREKKDDSDESSESDSSEDEDEDTMKEQLETAQIPHQGCVNRIRTTKIGTKQIAATWSETGKVHLWDLNAALEALENETMMMSFVQNGKHLKPIYTFRGHQTEGFAMDWSPTSPGGVLATGDCKKNIHIWKPVEGSSNSWHIDQRPYVAHSSSVEDLQWSPSESNVLASCGVDKSIRIWDIRAVPHKACMLTAANAHDSDVNVISWNRTEPFIVSGGDDGVLKIWDLRQFQGAAPSPVAIFKHHTAAITSVEWHPCDNSVFAASGEDDQVTQWDIAVERDIESTEATSVKDAEMDDNLPPQLLFVHQGQKEIKEVHWHRQIPGVVISSSADCINIFRTVSC